MTPSVKLSKKIIQDDPRNLVCYVTLTVLYALNIPSNIFVVKYTPPRSASDTGGRSFYNVAYVDQFEDLPTEPEDSSVSCFIRSHTVTKSFANKAVAEKWCTEVYAEIGRLLSTYELKDLMDGRYTEVTITKSGVTETSVEENTVMPEVQPVSYTDDGNTGNPDNSEDPDINYEVIDLSFNGEEVVI